MSRKLPALCAAVLLAHGAAPTMFGARALAQGFIDPAQLSVPETGTFTLTLLSDKPAYRPKDSMVFFILSQEDCKLTLADVDSTGSGSVLFPNKVQSNNLLQAGKALVIGDRASPIRLVAGDTETHTIVAQCVTGAGALVRKTLKLDVE
jgi:hypothetical protein